MFAHKKNNKHFSVALTGILLILYFRSCLCNTGKVPTRYFVHAKPVLCWHCVSLINLTNLIAFTLNVVISF